jgi:mono/diheme cytochrome c family protein
MLGMVSCQEFPQGEEVYNAYCLNCHSSDGSGLGTLIPPLNGSRFQELELEYVACKIKFGNPMVEDFYAAFNPMPTFSNLSETDISNLLNYMNSEWGNTSTMTSPQEVKDVLSLCQFNPERETN